VKKLRKRQKKKKSRQAYEEDALQDTLKKGKEQIQEKFDADCSSVGPKFRVGDGKFNAMSPRILQG
jgi:hypothetical protein